MGSWLLVCVDMGGHKLVKLFGSTQPHAAALSDLVRSIIHPHAAALTMFKLNTILTYFQLQVNDVRIFSEECLRRAWCLQSRDTFQRWGRAWHSGSTKTRCSVRSQW
jgi:hypothetical protein